MAKNPHSPRFSDATSAAICDAIAGGASLRAAARSCGISESAARKWRKERPAFEQAYKEACHARLLAMEERLLDLCAQAHEVAQDTAAGHARVQAVKLEIDTLKWQLCKLMPARYGDKQTLEMTGANGTPLHQTTPEQLQDLAERIAAARNSIEAQAREKEAQINGKA
jgi:hypothetical protein